MDIGHPAVVIILLHIIIITIYLLFQMSGGDFTGILKSLLTPRPQVTDFNFLHVASCDLAVIKFALKKKEEKVINSSYLIVS